MIAMLDKYGGLCEERSDEAILVSALKWKTEIASSFTSEGLAKTRGDGLLRYACNDI